MAARSGATVLALAASLLCSVALAAQDDGDIVVTGERPHIEAGLWHFSLSPSHGVSEGVAGRAQTMSRGHEWDVCIPEGELDRTVMRLLGGEPVQRLGIECGAMRVRIAKGRLSASLSCDTRAPGETEIYQLTRDYVGKLSATKLDISITTRSEHDGERTGETFGKLTAERVGQCPSQPKASAVGRPAPSIVGAEPLPPAEPAAPPRAPPADEAPAPLPRPPSSDSSAAAGTQAATPADIVVIARKLKKIRLHFASEGRHFSWCHADISSGDPRLDRVGCAIVRTCVEQGYDDQDSALGCFNAKVATLEDSSPREPSEERSR